jgi:hypothetical protein
LSDAADPQTRTFEARYVLDGEAAAAPLGATVTVRLATAATEPDLQVPDVQVPDLQVPDLQVPDLQVPDLQVPLGAVLDDGQKTGVWVLDNATATVHFRPVKLMRVSGDTAVVSGLVSGDPVVALGAHLLREGARVRTTSERGGK